LGFFNSPSHSTHYGFGKLRPLAVKPELAKGILKEPLPLFFLKDEVLATLTCDELSAFFGAIEVVVDVLSMTFGGAGCCTTTGGGGGLGLLEHIN